MRVLLAGALAAAGLAAVALGASSCGDKVQSGLTGIDIQVTFESDLPVRYLRFAGFIDQQPAFPRDDRPHAGDDRELDPTDENLIVLLPDTMGEKSVFIRVDGVDQFGSILASSGEARMVERDKILAIRLHLGEPRVCGDGQKHPSAEMCDDGNQLGDDGCSGECVVEAGWACEGTPSVCRTCGDGVCSVGEDHCSCMADCEGIATCGDGLCCPGRDESPCSCPQDCLEEGAVTCPDGYCCEAERAAGNCMPDCGECGNGACERDKGEDACTCAADCADQANEPVCGNQDCCTVGGESTDTCPVDCCPPSPVDGDGICCPNESADTSPADCCATMAQCGDSSCCPGEDPASCAECCPSPVCGDGTCCGGENAQDCPQDCCPACGDFVGCAGCCAGGCQGAQCDLACEAGCSCYFDCGQEGCNVECASSSCFVECPGEASCKVTCSDDTGGRDGGVIALPGASNCYCRGPGCVLDCPSGTPQIDCGDGGIACGFAGCP